MTWRDEFHESLTESPSFTSPIIFRLTSISTLPDLRTLRSYMGTREAHPSRRSDKDDARYESVTLEDIRRITKKYLSEEKFVISVVQPGK